MLRIAFIVALGGFLMGFDASVISGVLGPVGDRFGLTEFEQGWLVACLALTSSFAMLGAGVFSDAFGRRRTLQLAAALYLVSALASALAPGYSALVIARMLGGLGVGAALIVAPLYIAELAPAKDRGRLVSINQLNIVIGISAAFFSNYVIAQVFADLPEATPFPAWRWMLGIEAVPALAYLLGLGAVPESPRWLKLRGEGEKAFAILAATAGETEARAALERIAPSEPTAGSLQGMLRRLLDPALRPILAVALGVAVLQQITGINAVFFYAPMIFEKAGAGVNSALLQAVLIGVVNLLFTLVALRTIDRLGRRPLLLLGLGGIALAMALLSFAFDQAHYSLSTAALAALDDSSLRASLAGLGEQRFADEAAFRGALAQALGPEVLAQSESALLSLAIQIDAVTVLAAIMLFVASFALSLGPVMWVLFSELFPLPVRALAAATAGLVNSLVSFLVQLLFPWALAALGPSQTFGLFGAFALLGLFWVGRAVPETRGRPLEAMEGTLTRSP